MENYYFNNLFNGEVVRKNLINVVIDLPFEHAKSNSLARFFNNSRNLTSLDFLYPEKLRYINN